MKKILSVFVAVAFVLPSVSFAYFTEANIIEELQSKIAYLLEQVESLKKQLAEKQSGSVTEFCYNFDSNLQIGSSNSNAVNSLLTALVKEGVAVERGSNFSGTFDETMASYVTAFQEKYRNEILTPNGLKNGTGYLGRSTRAKLNALYGCKKPNPSVCTIENPCTNMPVVKTPSTSTSNCPLSVDSNGNISHVCSTNNDLIVVKKDQEFTLKLNQEAKLEDVDLNIKISSFINSPCPVGTNCIWSGLGVNLVYIFKGKEINEKDLKNYGFDVIKGDSDYKSYIKLKIINSI